MGAGESLELGSDTDRLGSKNDLVGVSFVDLVGVLGCYFLLREVRLIGSFIRAGLFVARFFGVIFGITFAIIRIIIFVTTLLVGATSFGLVVLSLVHFNPLPFGESDRMTLFTEGYVNIIIISFVAGHDEHADGEE